MEFPETGKRCSMKDCKLLDFLPFVCEQCQDTFCKEHFNMESHDCLKTENLKSTAEQSASFLCSKESCKASSPVEMLCVKCKKHFCVTHRHHGCLDLGETERTQKLKKWQIPKKQFAEAKAIVDQQIADSLKKSKNTTLANKVLLYITYKTEATLI
jgi:AN1-type zinc finger protein 1